MNHKFTCIIIDDEELARQRLIRLITPYNVFEVIAQATNGQEGLKLVEEHQPDVIFLDVEMPVMNGFEMLSKLKKQPKVIFTTAYDQYAIKAFEENSLDYLLKPVEKDRLEKCIAKLQATHKPMEMPLQQLLEQLKPKKEIKTLTVKIGDKILLIQLNAIIAIEAEEKYVFLLTEDGNKHLTDFTLSNLEDRLPDTFCRIHRSTIINTDKIKEIRKSFNGALVFVMNNKEQSKFTSSRSNSEALRERFDI
ncbi:LytR/AlgR family response regulator transcription factor [Pedobacter cryophilus]|uniref:Response regulator transcription factor n=1 Tax=Pedobacter cryophilus TaxID=2571271 RepID=A0A4U1C537_9SPHI|nr:LytTR family DNA-binding domain-containing protein [Pedobacter cryophilus]TKC00442.1 response regulator transcription factor [Pedobacter cryophilus]